MDLVKTQEKIVDKNIQILVSSTLDPTVERICENKDLLISKLTFDKLFKEKKPTKEHL